MFIEGGMGGRSLESRPVNTAILLCLSANVENGFLPPSSRMGDIGGRVSLATRTGSITVVRMPGLISDVLLDRGCGGGMNDCQFGWREESYKIWLEKKKHVYSILTSLEKDLFCAGAICSEGILLPLGPVKNGGKSLDEVGVLPSKCWWVWVLLNEEVLLLGPTSFGFCLWSQLWLDSTRCNEDFVGEDVGE